ncbi:hypothetical protein FJ695_11645 [Labrenzia sp. PHM005]|nr:hypothetical protein FJ695_11645 [Labrenzia sp. PHM005]
MCKRISIAQANLFKAAGGLLLLIGLAACQGSPQPPSAISATPTAPQFIQEIDQEQGVTFAFEPFTGAPGNIADELSSEIGAKAATQGLKLVRRVGADATYRVNGYLAATGQPGQGTIFYVFDVVDRSGRRLKRISGTEETGGSTGDPWTGASSDVLSRIAERSVVEIKAWLNQ